MTSTEIISTTTVDQYKELVRRTAQQVITGQGYGDYTVFNPVLARLGVEPFPNFQAKVAVRIAKEATFPVSSSVTDRAAALEFAQANARDYIDFYELRREAELDSIEIVQLGADEAADPDAGTEDLTVYQRLVRREAIRLAAANDWCDSGLNGVLEQLGLPPKQTFRVPVDVMVRQRVSVAITDAETLEEARERVAAGEHVAEVQQAAGAGPGSRVRYVEHALPEPGVYVFGDPDPTGYGERGNSTSRATREGRCGVSSPSGYVCTWESADHAGDHVAASYNEILAVWPKA